MSDVVVPRSRHFSWAALLLSLSLGLLCFGCAPAASTKKTTTKATKTADEEAESRTLRNLQNALADLQADKLGIDSSPEQAIANLNEWAKGAKRLAEKTGTVWEPTRPHDLLKSQPKEWLEQVALVPFVERDAVFLRDSLWVGQMAKLGAGDAKSNLDVIVNLFEYVVRNVDLIPSDSRDIPLGPFDVMMLGRGTVKDRAWLFAELLRQRSIDTVILTPRRAQRDTNEADLLLVGVLLEKDILLFDSQLGMPLPGDVAAPKSAVPRLPMTLRQAIGDSELLTTIASDSEGRFSWTAPMLAGSQVELICQTQQLSSRMRFLQQGLAGEQSTIVSDPLEDVGDEPGLWKRVAQHPAATWSEDDVAIWSFPETTRGASALLTTEQMREWATLSMSLAAPQRLMYVKGDEVSRTMQLGFTKPERALGRFRMQHVTGRWPEAVQGYLAAQLYDVETPTTKDLARVSSDGKERQPFAIVSTVDKQFLRGLMMQPAHAQVRRLHLLAGDDACYWVALCQFEQNRLRAVVDQCRMYDSQHSSGGWVAANQTLMATALARQDKLKEAILALREFDEKAPSFAGSRVLMARWKRLLESAE